MKPLKRSDELYERACRVMPAGVNSPVRAFRAVGGTPRFIAEASGCRLMDADGNTAIDWVGSWGALILGHAHPAVSDAAAAAARRGSSYGAPHEGEVLLAEAVVEAMPAIQMLRFVSSGTEAVMSAVRLARGATGRPCILKFDGCYHGHADALLAKAGSGVATFGLPDSAGVPPETTAHTLVTPYNDLSAAEEALRRNEGRVAAVLVEPVAGNMGVAPPTEGFLEGLRRLSTEHGALLVFDEVITGFRVARGGASERYGVRPDLITIGKIVGGGLPAAAYGGRRDLMEQMAPLGPVYQAGTLSGNPVAMAAGLATLRHLDAALYERLETLGAALERGLVEAAAAACVPARVNRVGSMLSVFLTDCPVTDMASASSTDRALYARLFHGLLERGVYIAPSALESWFVSAAHGEAEVEATLAAFREALADAVAPGGA
ncbi:MAG TPA: glutamate-1-semialdehyde 2,1-aminomutase [Chthonomonadales bacterium]|nr:glutamate-1-semialdehyde 2,1-aminomutase [Chthonomonadales bacterium]